MKQKTLIAIFVAITAVSSNNLCMEIKKADCDYQKLEDLLKQNLVDNYNTIPRADQYDILKTFIDSDDMQSLSLCLSYKFNPNRYHKGLSLLHSAIQHNNSDALWLLANANADLVPLNKYGETPLDYAMRLRCTDCINAMSRIMQMKIVNLKKNKMHCGLIKHILKPKYPCSECLDELGQQLQWHGLTYPSYSDNSSYYSTATDASSSYETSDSDC